MNELSVNYASKGFSKYLAIAVSLYSILLSLYLCITQALIPNYNFLFWGALILIVISVVLLLNLTVWQPKPIFIINQEYFTANIEGQNNVSIEWDKVAEVGIGISSLMFKTTDSKQYEIDLVKLKYNDLKEVKSKTIELCENKNIAFRNN